MKRLVRWLVRIGIGLVGLVVVLAVAVYALDYKPADVEDAELRCAASTPTLRAGQPVKIMSWNVQYLAGRGYVFYYDLPNGDGPDTRPSAASIARTLSEVVAVIKQENPDVVQLQEVDRGSARTDQRDELAEIQTALGGAYPCTASAFYHKNAFVPLPQIMGSVGMSLGTLSKTRIESATRYQLPHICGDPVTVAFNFDRAMLASRLAVDGGRGLTVMQTHLDAFAQGCDTMTRQVGALGLIADKQGTPWVLSGDLNLLATDAAYSRLDPVQRGYYNPHTELTPLLDRFRHFPTTAQIDSGDPQFFTHFPNDPSVTTPDRTIDYYLYSSGLTVADEKIRHDDPKISDHFPMLTTVTAP